MKDILEELCNRVEQHSANKIVNKFYGGANEKSAIDAINNIKSKIGEKYDSIYNKAIDDVLALFREPGHIKALIEKKQEIEQLRKK